MDEKLELYLHVTRAEALRLYEYLEENEWISIDSMKDTWQGWIPKRETVSANYVMYNCITNLFLMAEDDYRSVSDRPITWPEHPDWILDIYKRAHMGDSIDGGCEPTDGAPLFVVADPDPNIWDKALLGLEI